MPFLSALPVMPKERQTPSMPPTSFSVPYPTTASASARNAAIWSSADDNTLMRARASGLNWGPIARKHFPNKTSNACRKRHERLMERRNVDDWDSHKLELLATEYMEARKQMWEIMASRLGERWQVLEAKCMEKGLKTLQTTARTAQRKAGASRNDSYDEQGSSDHNSDSGVGLYSDTEMEVGLEAGPSTQPSSWRSYPGPHPPELRRAASRSLPHPPALVLYQPPPPVRRVSDGAITASPAMMSSCLPTQHVRQSPDLQNGRGGMSIQSVLSPPDTQ